MRQRNFGPWSSNGGLVLCGFALIFGTPCVVSAYWLLKGWL